MKQFIYILGVTLALMCCTLSQAKTRVVTEQDSVGNTKVVIELNDTVVNGKAVTDTLSITTYADEREAETSLRHDRNGSFFSGLDIGHTTMVTVISTTAIVFCFMAPVLVIFLVCYYRNKNRKEKYRLVEQALAAGQPLPENIFQDEASDTLRRGIRNIFLGLGVFIFLWALTEEFGLACIGLLLMFMGFGQVVIHYVGNKPSNKSYKSDK